MKKRTRRLLSLVIGLILVAGLLPGTAFAAEPAKITSVALTGAPESYTVGEELGTLTSPGGVGEGIDIEGYMMVESDMNSFHYYAVTPMSPTSTFKADKYYYYVVMIDSVGGYSFTDSTIYSINGKTARAEYFAADENNCMLCVVPYDKTTGQLKNYNCPIAVPNGFTAIDSVDISGVPESFTPGDVIDVDLEGDSFTVSNPHAILETDRDWYVEWYKSDSDTVGFYDLKMANLPSHAVYDNETFSGDKYYYILIILTADVENGYMFTENTTFTINGKTAAWSMYATAGLFAYVFAAVREDAPAVQPTTNPTTAKPTTAKPTTAKPTTATPTTGKPATVFNISRLPIIYAGDSLKSSIAKSAFPDGTTFYNNQYGFTMCDGTALSLPDDIAAEGNNYYLYAIVRLSSYSSVPSGAEFVVMYGDTALPCTDGKTLTKDDEGSFYKLYKTNDNKIVCQIKIFLGEALKPGTTVKPTTAKPTTAKPTTAKPTTAKPTTAKPTTAKPTTAKPTTKPTTIATTQPTTAVTTKATTVTTTARPTATTTTAVSTTAKATTAAATTAKATTGVTTVAPTTITPTVAPTTITPTVVPTTITPTVAPTSAATTVVPTAEPTAAPTQQPTTAEPTDAPSVAPSVTPSTAPGGTADGGEEAPNLLWLWIVIAAVAVGGIVLFIIIGKKKKQ